MNKGKSATGDSGLGFGSAYSLLPGQLVKSDVVTSTATSTSSKGDPIGKPLPAPTSLYHQTTPITTTNNSIACTSTNAPENTFQEISKIRAVFDDVNLRIKYIDKETKFRNRSSFSKFMEYSSFASSLPFSESLKKQNLLNGNSQSYLNQEACAAQVRTIMRAAGLASEKLPNRKNLKLPNTSNITAAHLSSQKMTLMAELFASEEEDGDEDEIFKDDIDDPIGINAQLDTDNVEYEDDDEEEEEEEEDEDEEEDEKEIQGDDGEEGDDEEEDDEEDENSEVESFTLEEESCLDSKFTHSVDPLSSGHLCDKDLELRLSASLTASNATNASDSQLYHKIHFASPNVHTVLNQVGAQIENLRLANSSDEVPYIVQKLQTNVIHATTNCNLQPANSSKNMTSDCRQPTATYCQHQSAFDQLYNQHVDADNVDADEQDGLMTDSPPASFDPEEMDGKERQDSDKLLLYASASGHDDMVQLILTTQKVDVNRRGAKEMTPLMEAASGGYIDIIRLLLNYGADVSCKTKQGNTVLMYACAMGHLEVVKELINRGANIEDQNENGHTPLMEAASAGHVEVARFLVNQGCNIYVHSNEYKETALTLAAYKGHLDMVRFLINAGADRDNRAEEMHTALMEASMDGHVQVARLLIDSGAEVNMPPDSFESPLTLAACGGHVELALLLIERGANIEEVNDEGYTALMEAAREGHEEMVALLIRHGAQVNATTEESKETALFMAAGTGCLEVVNLLIKAGADIELGTSTPLLEASQEGHLQVVKRLLEANANPNAKNSAGESPLTVAADNGYPGVVRLLLEAGAHVDHCEGGKTALMKAASNNHAETVQLLISAGAQVNQTTSNNEQTALSLACKEGATAVVEILLNSGADLFHRLKDNSTMLIEAAKNGHTAIVQMLIDYHYLPLMHSSSEQDDAGKLDELYESVVNSLDPASHDCKEHNYPPRERNNTSSTSTTLPQIELIIESGWFQFNESKGVSMPEMYDMFPPKDASEFYRKILQTRHLLPQKAKSSCQGGPSNDDGHPDDETDARLDSICPDLNELYRSGLESINAAGIKTGQIPYCQKDNLDALRKTLSSLVFDDNFTIDTEMPPNFEGTNQQEKMDIKGNLNDISSDMSKAFALAQLPVSFPSEFFNFASRLLKKESKSDNGTTVTHVCNTTAVAPVVVQPASASTAAFSAVQPAATKTESNQVFKRNKTCKSAHAYKTSPNFAATVSINTNTTSTATTAVCNLMPQSAQAESAAFTPSASLSTRPLSTSMATATTPPTLPLKAVPGDSKAKSKLKHAAAAPQPKGAHSADPVNGKMVETAISSPPCQGQACSPETTTAQQPASGQPAKGKTSAPSIDLNSQTDSNHDTALTIACAGGHVDLVKLLLARGADIEHREKKGLSPLMLAATNGHAKIVDILFSHGADLEAQTERTKDTALSLACSSGRYEVVENLLSRGANKEHRNVSDYTPLSLAASGGYVPIINLLLSHQAEINSRTGSKLGISPLMLAAMNGHTEASRQLLDRGSDINAYIETNRNTALTLACFQGRTEVVSLLVDRNANIEHRAKTGLTPLMEAASGGYVEVGRVLLDKGADVNAPPVPASRDTALTIAADKGHASFVELLIQRGAMVDVKNKKGYSPLWLACNGGHFEVATILVNAKCDVDSQDNRKISCLMAAFRRGHVKIVKFLVKHVTQFPSDQEIDRCLALCADEELNKKAALCAEILHQAKERQAAEAYKNAANLLEEIDQERTREESRKAAAARKRERRKQKKKADKSDDVLAKFDESDCKDDENLLQDDESREDEAPAKPKKKKKKKNKKSSNAAAEAIPAADEEDEDDDTTALTIDEDDFDSYDNFDDLGEVSADDEPMLRVIADMARNKAESKKKNKKKSKKTKESEPKVFSDFLPAPSVLTLAESAPKVSFEKMVSEPLAPQPNQVEKKNSKKNNNNKSAATKAVVVPEKTKDAVEAPVKSKPTTNDKQPSVNSQTVPSLFKKIDDDGSLKMAEPVVDLSKASTDYKSMIADFSDLDSFHEDSSWNEPAFTTVNKSSRKNAKKNEAAAGNSTQGASATLTKREEGWKEVVRKSKKVLVPSNAISRVIGRGGCNINTIREVSGAHIEVEKQKGQGDRMVIIRGSADATRHAHTLITVLSKETEKELAEIIRELGLDSCCPTAASTITSATTNTVTEEEKPAITSLVVPEITEHSFKDQTLSSMANQVLNATANSARSLKTKSVSSGVKPSTNQTNSNINPTLVFTSSSLSRSSKSQSSIASLDTINWTNSYGKAASQTATPSTIAPYTKAINSKTRNFSATTTVASSTVSSDAENETTSPAAMLSNVAPECVDHMVHRDSSQRNTPTMQAPRLSLHSLQQPQPQQLPQSKFNSTNVHLVDTLSFDSTNQIPFKSNVANSVFPTQFAAGNISSAPVTNANQTMVFTPSNLPKGAKSPSNNTASLDSINWTNSYGKAAPQAAMTSSANTDSFTVGINSKTRNLSANTTMVSSKVSSDTESRTISPAIMSTVPSEGLEHLIHRDASQRNTPTMQVPRNPPYSLQPQQQQQPQPPQSKFNSSMDGLSFESPNQISSNHYKGNVGNSLFPSPSQFVAGSISNTAVRAAIVNYSMNLFQNQVPKQHQEAASRLAHLSAQNSNFVSSEFQNVFIGNNGNGPNTVGISNNAVNSTINTNGAMHSAAPIGSHREHEKTRLLNYMYQGQYKQPSLSMSGSTSTNTYAQSQPNSQYNSSFGQPGAFAGMNSVRNALSSSTGTPTFSSLNYVNSSESLNLNTVPSNIYPTLSQPLSTLNNNTEIDEVIQRAKQPAPIGTERAQRKNPLHAFGSTLQTNHGIGNIANQGSMSSNSIFSDQSFHWNIGNSTEFVPAPQDPIFPSTNPNASSFNSDYSELFPGSTSTVSNLPELNPLDSYSVLNRQSSLQPSSYNLQHHQHQQQHQQQPQQQQPQPQKFNSVSLMDGLFFDSANQVSPNPFSNVNNAGNSLFSATAPFLGGNATNIDSDYWSSSSSSSHVKQTAPNCSTSGINSAFDSKLGWNTWNN